MRGQHPVFPALSWLERVSDEAKLGRIAPREREAVAAVRKSEGNRWFAGRNGVHPADAIGRPAKIADRRLALLPPARAKSSEPHAAKPTTAPAKAGFPHMPSFMMISVP